MRQLLNRLSEGYLLLALLLALPALLLVSPVPLSELSSLVDWATLAALTGLMILSRGLEDSGSLLVLGRFLLSRLHSQRRLAVALVLFAGLLSTVLTNDVALFIVVPLTLGLRSAADLKLGRLIVFEAFAVNAGSALSPIGNPQNLFLWQSSGAGFVEFILAMLPLAMGLLVLVLLAVVIGFPSRALQWEPARGATVVRKPLLYCSLLCYPLFLLLAEQGWAPLAAAAVGLFYLLFFRRVLLGIDWLLLLVFALMFVDLGLLARLPLLLRAADYLEQLPGGIYGAGVLLSQLISNVPAAILLESFSDDWRALAWGVSVGGFGVAIGSLANLIALRLARMPGLYREFHAWSLPLLVLASALGWWWL